MVAALGSGKPAFHRHLVSDTPSLPLRALPAFDKSVDLAWQKPAGAALTRVSRTAEGLVIETGGTTTRVTLRSWVMPAGRGGDHGIRIRMVCPRCGTFRDVLHWRGEWGCRGKDCFNLEHACRHELRYCPAIRRRAKLLRKLARVSPRGLKARLLRAQIANQQAAMIANLRRANRDLTKRSRHHARHGRVNSSQ